MRGQRVLVTGGAGLVGSHIVDLLVQGNGSLHPREIVVLDNFARGRIENLVSARSQAPVTVINGDIGDRKLLSEVMQGIDVVFHQAAIRITQCAEEPRLALEVLADGTFNVLEAAAKAGVKKVVAASSASVYGLAEEFPTTEHHHPYNNRTLYGAAKALLDKKQPKSEKVTSQIFTSDWVRAEFDKKKPDGEKIFSPRYTSRVDYQIQHVLPGIIRIKGESATGDSKQSVLLDLKDSTTLWETKRKAAKIEKTKNTNPFFR